MPVSVPTADLRGARSGRPPTASQRARVLHHLIGFLDPRSATRRALRPCARGDRRDPRAGRRALVGGTGYLRALSGNVAPTALDPVVRIAARVRIHRRVLHAWLPALEPQRAAQSPRAALPLSASVALVPGCQPNAPPNRRQSERGRIVGLLARVAAEELGGIERRGCAGRRGHDQRKRIGLDAIATDAVDYRGRSLTPPAGRRAPSCVRNCPLQPALREAPGDVFPFGAGDRRQ